MAIVAAWLVVGLGNPGSKYERTRHNIGFRVVDALADRQGLPALRASKFGGDLAQGTLKTSPRNDAEPSKIVVLRPMEFMNLSGFAVQRVAGFHHIPVENIVVVHDEIDLDFGLIRLKSGGGHGGHNGLRSIIEQLGNKFARVRVGVSKPGAVSSNAPAEVSRGVVNAADAANKDVAGWVLGDFSASQAKSLDAIIDASVVAVEEIVTSGIAQAMNARNGIKNLA
jgi:peptidyl-tRNA hydrolase, PTH1 family